jgi:hypothetical protein
LGDVKALNDDVKGIQGTNSLWEGKTPLSLGIPRCLYKNVLLSLWGKPLVYVYPWLQSQHPFGGILSLWRSKIIISPHVPLYWEWLCKKNKYSLCGLIIHRDNIYFIHI